MAHPKNPMLAYLVRRSRVLAASDGTGNALVWLGVHAWFEGTLAGRSTLRPRTLQQGGGA